MKDIKMNTDRQVCNAEVVNNYRELLSRTISKYPDNVAYKYKKDPTASKPEYVEKTYSKFGSDIKALATKLLDLGLEQKRIIVIGKNRYEWCVSYLAITTGNMIVAPMDRALPDNEIESLVERSKADAIIFDQKYLDTMKELKSENEKIILICMDDVNEPNVLNYSKVLEDGISLVNGGNNIYDNLSIDENVMSIMLFTSGTTNKPKIVMLSQKNICSNISAVATVVRLYPTDTLLSFLPIHHTFECTITFLYGIYGGCTVAFCDGIKYIQQNLKEYKVSVFVAVPLVLETMYKKIVKAIEDKGKTKAINILSKVSRALLKIKIDLRKVFFKQILDNFGGHLRVVFYGAAPMHVDTIVGYNNLGIYLLQGYGLTETSPVVTAETDNEQRPGSVGLALPNLQVYVDNPDNEGVGEILVKGPSVMLGYFENEEENKKVFKDGFFRTGDYGYIGKDRFIYITGRKKDIIVLQNGKNVYPQEIEGLINKIPYVTESIVYLRERTSTDTSLAAKIVYDKEKIKEQCGEKTEEEYKEILWEQIKDINKDLPKFKYVKDISITTEAFAKTTTQKIKRYEELKKIN